MPRKGLARGPKAARRDRGAELTLVDRREGRPRAHRRRCRSSCVSSRGSSPTTGRSSRPRRARRARLNRDDFLAALRRTSLLASERSHGVKLQLEQGTTRAVGQQSGAGRGQRGHRGRRTAATRSPSASTPATCIDVLTVHASGDVIELALTDEVGPGVLRGSQDPDIHLRRDADAALTRPAPRRSRGAPDDGAAEADGGVAEYGAVV